MIKAIHCGCHVGKRDFLKTSAVAGAAAALPTASLLAGEASKDSRPRRMGAKSKVLFINDAPEAHSSFVDSIRAIKGMNLQVTSAKINFRQMEEARNRSSVSGGPRCDDGSVQQRFEELCAVARCHPCQSHRYGSSFLPGHQRPFHAEGSAVLFESPGGEGQRCESLCTEHRRYSSRDGGR